MIVNDRALVLVDVCHHILRELVDGSDLDRPCWSRRNLIYFVIGGSQRPLSSVLIGSMIMRPPGDGYGSGRAQADPSYSARQNKVSHFFCPRL